MIPKKIHYCWFGRNEFPELAIKCIESWKKILPDYEIIRWDESNFDIESNLYVKQAYESKKYAFVTDYVRLYALYNYGGIYMDTDVEVLQRLDKFLVHKAFSGFESPKDIPTGIMACEKNFEGFKKLLSYYDGKEFILPDGNLDLKTNVESITEFYASKGLKRNNTLQTVDNFTLYPKITFCPWKSDLKQENKDKIYTIHHFAGSWLPIEEKKKRNSKWYKFKNKTKCIIRNFIISLIGVNLWSKMRGRG